MHKKLKTNTILSHYAEDRNSNNGAVVPPIYQNSLFTFKDWDAIDSAFDDPVNNYIYTRGKNPSVATVEEKIAKIANGEKAKLFSSGMGAISAAIMHYLSFGDHVITINNIYGPANNFLNKYLKKKMNIEVAFVSGKSIDEIENAIKENTSLIYLESPSTAVYTLQNIKEIAQLAKKNNINTVIDNTWATPIFQKPLTMGIDLEVHSCSKYLAGHSDVVAGVIIGKAKDIDQIFLNEHALFGAKLAPFEAWLILRSLRTLPIRMKQHQENAMKIAAYLESHPKINQVLYPGLKSFKQYELAKKQMTGYSGLLSFILATEDLNKIKKFVNSLEIFKIGVSWGGHESLVYVPAISYLKELTPEQFNKMGISLGTIRISVGLEDCDDLIEDIKQALDCI